MRDIASELTALRNALMIPGMLQASVTICRAYCAHGCDCIRVACIRSVWRRVVTIPLGHTDSCSYARTVCVCVTGCVCVFVDKLCARLMDVAVDALDAVSLLDSVTALFDMPLGACIRSLLFFTFFVWTGEQCIIGVMQREAAQRDVLAKRLDYVRAEWARVSVCIDHVACVHTVITHTGTYVAHMRPCTALRTADNVTRARDTPARTRVCVS
jgi:hypothetical protein